MNEQSAPTGTDTEGAGEAGIDKGASQGILVEEEHAIERIELDAAEQSSVEGLGWDTAPAHDDVLELVEPGEADGQLDDAGASSTQQRVQVEEEELRLAAELTELRRTSAERERQLEAELEAARGIIADRDAELSGQVAQIASLTLECSGLRARLHNDDEPSVAVGNIGSHAAVQSEDLISRLKQRLEERGRAIALARKENEALVRECARLRQALGPRAGRPDEAAASAASPFGRGVMRLLKRVRGTEPDEVVDAALSGVPGTEVPTVIVGSPVQAGLDPQPQPRQPPAAPRPGAAPQARPTLRRYLIALDPDADDVHELRRPRLNVGRGDDADLRLTDSTVSRFHAIVTLVDGRTMVEDASSTNGVFVNNVRVRRAVLKDGDTVAFGNERYQYRVGPAGVREAAVTHER